MKKIVKQLKVINILVSILVLAIICLAGCNFGQDEYSKRITECEDTSQQQKRVIDVAVCVLDVIEDVARVDYRRANLLCETEYRKFFRDMPLIAEAEVGLCKNLVDATYASRDKPQNKTLLPEAKPMDCGNITAAGTSSDQSSMQCYQSALLQCKPAKVRQVVSSDVSIYMISELYDANLCVVKVYNPDESTLQDVVCYEKLGDQFRIGTCSSELRQEMFNDKDTYFDGWDFNDSYYCGTKKYESVSEDQLVSGCFASKKTSCVGAYMFDYGNEGKEVYLHLIKPLSNGECIYTLYYKNQIVSCYDANTGKEVDCLDY